MAKSNLLYAQQQRFLQKMALTPQMRQSLSILGMTTKDLNEHINTILANNPCLKKLIDDNRFRDKYARPAAAQGEMPADHDARQAQEVDPREALLSQLRIAGLTDDEMEIAEYLVSELDGNGYITANSEDVAADLGVSADDVESIVEAIQRMEPPGIGARDVRECLQLQLERSGKAKSVEYEIAGSFLEELARNDAGAIAKALNIDEARAREAMAHVKKLNPRPGSTLLGAAAARVIPDLIATVDRRKVRIEINRAFLPRLEIYNPYANNEDIVADPEARKFLAENTAMAKGLLTNLKRREETLCKVTEYILKYQREAILTHKGNLKTLTIKDVARALDFHQSTISRAISNKYVQINDNVTPLRDLLTHGMADTNGGVVSKASVKDRIGALIRQEDQRAPLSDGRIQELLEREGFAIKRRTVAKYREELKILPGHLRKRSG